MLTDNITVAMDEEFMISLQSIATAGYLWKIESIPDTIQLLSTENDRPEGAAKPGDATLQVFRFRAQKTGEHQIIFVLARPWENKAIESMMVTLKVTN
jgi:predicted secreted protein